MVACGSQSKAVKVRGVVTLDDKPLANATVTFAPLHEGGRAANGFTAANGSFQLTTFSTNDGALPGEYKVLVSYEETAPEDVVSNISTMDLAQKAKLFARMSPKGKAAAAAQAKKKTKPTISIPAVYGDPKRSKLREVVPTNGEVRIELKSTGET
jgi:hypothetical protein